MKIGPTSGPLKAIVFVGWRLEITLVNVLLLIAFYRHALNPSGFQELSLLTVLE
jgi:hypothetical protein